MRAILNLYRKTPATHPFLVLPSESYQDSNSNQSQVEMVRKENEVRDLYEIKNKDAY
jgi:hypothetical protein